MASEHSYNPGVTDANDPFNLERFVQVQDPVYNQVLSELRAASKTTHWIWFIFPQMRGLGRSEMATKYAIASRAEAEAYLAHPILGPRLRECTELVNAAKGRSLDQILGFPDVVKFQSSMTLFTLATPQNQVFETALDEYFDGARDERTIEGLK